MLSMLNHSCRPNCGFSAAGAGGLMATRALQRIAAGEELTVAYINLYEPRQERRATTAATKQFECGCGRCTEPLSQSADRWLVGAQCKDCGDVHIPAAEGASPGAATSWPCAGCGKLDPGMGAAAAASAAAALDAALDVYGRRGHAAARPLLEALLRSHEKARRACSL